MRKVLAGLLLITAVALSTGLFVTPANAKSIEPSKYEQRTETKYTHKKVHHRVRHSSQVRMAPEKKTTTKQVQHKHK